MKNIAPYSILISGICLTTFAHYAEIWVFAYGLAAIFTLLYFIVEKFTMMTIEELADKHDIDFYEIKTLQAFADEWLTLNSSEPVGYVTQKLIDFWGEFVGSNQIYAHMYKDVNGDCNVPLYKANPINQELQKEAKFWKEDSEIAWDKYVKEKRKLKELLESHKRLEEALELADKFVSWNAKERIAADWSPYTDIKQALASIPKSVKELK